MPSVTRKQDVNHPRQFSRILVRAEEEDLRHVDQDNANHEIRAPAVQGPDEPPQSDLVIESLQAIPRFSRRGDVYQRQKNPCDNLKHEHGQCGAPKD
jgi:hypothetical protein